jgi:hypothetical protein
MKDKSYIPYKLNQYRESYERGKTSFTLTQVEGELITAEYRYSPVFEEMEIDCIYPADLPSFSLVGLIDDIPGLWQIIEEHCFEDYSRGGTK